jgi:UDP-2,3-diacylglucosamine hydrolase
VPPAIGIGVADYFSSKSRITTGKTDDQFLGEEKEWLIIFSREMLKTRHFDYFIFGHRHLPIDFKLTDATRYINLGDWIKYNSYAVFDGQTVELKFYTK